MSKKQKRLFLIAGLLLIIVIIILLQTKNKKEMTPEPAPQPSEETEYTIQDAFPSDMLNDPQEDLELSQISELKNLTPISTPDFSIEYSYKTGNFIVKSNKSLSATEKNLELWLNKNGFDAIEDTRFEYQSSKLALWNNTQFLKTSLTTSFI